MLGKDHGTIDQGGIGADDRRQRSSQRTNARDALPLRAELGMEGDVQRIELGHALVERLFQVEPKLFGGSGEFLEIRQVALVAGPEMFGV